ncbi:diguanylate cyclase [Pontibacillus halophilus JSM 076056 = DSM 19796]|uniref:Diguanylate cyclase n=1 Tax=Pontibacillus halophilus JSM 076056 = DSM 19796 TaxID=1385510 RepID=A0A0A5GJ87_9BACI|nr:bifunctional diguanylate cyclase/phosphodiesterase [Pontibacillus halophilus]KGX91288.1 diguanylate cyclase [Pontibacillus halophilus JSM 076056 = DSM 19796]
MEMEGVYNVWLVILSIAVSIMSSYTALQIVKRLVRSRGMLRYMWIFGGSLTFGAGIWSMHFVAMLAYEMDMVVTYDTWLLILSILCAIGSSFVALYIISRGYDRIRYNFVGATLIGLSITSMHYVGMEAMQMGATIVYDNRLVIASVAIAWFASFVALQLFGYISKGERAKKPYHWFSWVSAVVMGIAISGMHYTGMESATFYHQTSAVVVDDSTIIEPVTLGYLIAAGIMFIIAFMITLIQYEAKVESTSLRLKMADQMYRSIIESANDGVVTVDERGEILAWNEAAEQIFRYTSGAIMHESFAKVVPTALQDEETHHSESPRRIQERYVGKTVELEGVRSSGERFPIELSLSTFHSSEDTYYTGIIRDITERREAEEQIQKLIYQDDLTELPNRRMLLEQIDSCVSQAKLHDEQVAVMFIDFDRFKQINDVYGHRVGDKLLIEIAKRTKSCLTEKDTLARQSGDEFVVVLPQTTHYQAGLIADKIISAYREPIWVEEIELYSTPSIGISLYPEDGTSDALITHADTAMYQAKKEGGNRYFFYTQEINDAISKKMVIETGLRKALENKEMELYYQPKVDVSSGKVNGFEALVRWNHPTLGTVSPAEFIPLAEETNLIIPLGEQILLQACTVFHDWLQQGYSFTHISVNISAVQFNQPTFISTIQRVLEQTGLAPHYLELELTESVVQNFNRARPILEKLKEMGIKLSLDDFGTGYSSLSYLKEFPLDTLKIDRSFIRTVDYNTKDQAVVDTIINMASKLNLNVVAEGIETKNQLKFIQQQSCHEYQGYYFSRPLPAAEIISLVKDHEANQYAKA